MPPIERLGQDVGGCRGDAVQRQIADAGCTAQRDAGVCAIATEKLGSADKSAEQRTYDRSCDIHSSALLLCRRDLLRLSNGPRCRSFSLDVSAASGGLFTGGVCLFLRPSSACRVDEDLVPGLTDDR
jgi:hypothetical protein